MLKFSSKLLTPTTLVVCVTGYFCKWETVTVSSFFISPLQVNQDLESLLLSTVCFWLIFIPTGKYLGLLVRSLCRSNIKISATVNAHVQFNFSLIFHVYWYPFITSFFHSENISSSCKLSIDVAIFKNSSPWKCKSRDKEVNAKNYGTTMHGFTPVSTILWKMVRFFIINIYYIFNSSKKKTFQVEIWELVWTN